MHGAEWSSIVGVYLFGHAVLHKNPSKLPFGGLETLLIKPFSSKQEPAFRISDGKWKAVLAVAHKELAFEVCAPCFNAILWVKDGIDRSNFTELFTGNDQSIASQDVVNCDDGRNAI